MLKLVPIAFAAACELVTNEHRHHKRPVGHKFSIGLEFDGELVGAIMVGRPVARHLDDGFTLEVTRCVVKDDVYNGCSKLYGAAARAAKELGYTKILTYTREDEGGASLRASGWKLDGIRPSRKGWTTPSRLREDTSTEHGVKRMFWVKELQQ